MFTIDVPRSISLFLRVPGKILIVSLLRESSSYPDRSPKIHGEEVETPIADPIFLDHGGITDIGRTIMGK